MDASFYPVAIPELSGNELKYVTECIETSWISSIGTYVTLFEEKFSEFAEMKHSLACCNGTAALHLALLALDIGAGDQVIVPDLTFIATANAVTYCNAEIIPVDVDIETGTMLPDAFEQAITERTKAVIPVHLYGHPAPMEEISDIAQKHNIAVVEDAAEAHGAEINGRKIGTFSDIAAFSFYGNKIITTGEGGMVCTDNKELYEKMTLLRNHGMSAEHRYYHPVVGYNYRMTNIQAAVGAAQLEQIHTFIDKKRTIASWYNEFLADCDYIILPKELPGYKNVFWLYAPRISSSSPVTRDEFCKRLENRGVQTRNYFYPVTEMPYYQHHATGKNAQSLSCSGINLPSYTQLSRNDIKHICAQIKDCFYEK